MCEPPTPIVVADAASFPSLGASAGVAAPAVAAERTSTTTPTPTLADARSSSARDVARHGFDFATLTPPHSQRSRSSSTTSSTGEAPSDHSVTDAQESPAAPPPPASTVVVTAPAADSPAAAASAAAAAVAKPPKFDDNSELAFAREYLTNVSKNGVSGRPLTVPILDESRPSKSLSSGPQSTTFSRPWHDYDDDDDDTELACAREFLTSSLTLRNSGADAVLPPPSPTRLGKSPTRLGKQPPAAAPAAPSSWAALVARSSATTAATSPRK